MPENEQSSQSEQPQMGYMCSYVPVEILSAAGFVPYRLTGDTKPISEAYSYLPTTCCSFQRSILERALRKEFDFLAGVIIPQTCDLLRESFDIWKSHTDLPFYHRLAVPLRTDTPAAIEFYNAELQKLATGLTRIGGREVDTADLQQAIVLHNRRRALLQELGKTRSSVSQGLNGRQMIELFLQTSMMAPEEAIINLEKVLNNLPMHQDRSNRLRIMLIGTELDNLDIISLIEEDSGMIVSDDLCYGSRGYNFQILVSEDPLTDLAKGYLGKINCPCKFPGERRWEWIIQEAAQSKPDGVIFLLQKFCDTHHFEQPDLEARLRDEGYPVMMLEIENQTSPEFLSTRVQAFLEMLAGERRGKSVE